MNATKYLSLAAIALMGTLASCQSDDDITVARPDNAVNMHLQVGSSVVTRSNAATTDADKQKQFNAGDQVSISATGQDAVIYRLQSDGQTWRETETNKFLLWNASQLEFQAYYPVTTGTSMTTFTLPTDQSIDENINAADYMTHTETIDRPTTGTDISLELERQTARVIVTISGFNDQYSDADKLVSGVHINSAAAAIADGAATGSVTTVTPYASGTGTQGSTYTALLIPAAANASANFITLTDGEGNTLNVKGIPALEAGKSYTYSLTVGKNTIKVQSVTVEDWTTGETLAGGKAEEQSAATPLDASTTAWTAGTYQVPAGGLTYGDAITVSGDVTLTLTDGETLTLNKGISLADGATLTIDGTGSMVVNGTNNSPASTVAGTGTLVLTSGTLTAKGGNGQGVNGPRQNVSGNVGGVAINGAVTVSGGTLTATGGAGGSVGNYNAYSTAAAGGAAISGSVTVSSGTLTATGGNGGDTGSDGGYSTAGAGGAAIGGDLTVNGGTTETTDGNNGVVRDPGWGDKSGAGGKAVAGTVTDNR